MRKYHIKFSDSPHGTHLAVVLGLIHGQRSITGQFNVKYHDKHVAELIYREECRDVVIADFKKLIGDLGL